MFFINTFNIKIAMVSRRLTPFLNINLEENLKFFKTNLKRSISLAGIRIPVLLCKIASLQPMMVCCDQWVYHMLLLL